MKSIGYLGPEGTFSHGAALKVKEKKNEQLELIGYNSIYDMAIAVISGDIDAALLPIENSIDGSVNPTMDMLSQNEGIYIYEEYVYPVVQNLISLSNMDIMNIKEIYSHPKAIGQCREFLNEFLKDAKIKSTFSTAEGVRKVKQEGTYENGYATIGTKEAAEIFGLEVIVEGIQETQNNVTRFILITDEMNLDKNNTRTSIVFATGDKPGSLFKVLEIFDLWDINLKRIESRPSKKSLGEYIFFVDLEGDLRESDLKEAFRILKLKTSFFSLLGSYPEYKL